MHRVSLQEKELSCPVCIDIFDEPKALPECAHNVCHKCLDNIAAMNRWQFVTCPVCRVDSYLPPGGVAKLPTNHFMKTVIDGLPGRKEIQSMKRALEQCEKGLSSSKIHVDDCDRSIAALKTAQHNALQVKKEISDHAKYLIDVIQRESTSLTTEVDERIENTSSLLSNLRREKKKTLHTLRETEKIVSEARGLIERGNTEEIIGKKAESVSKLQENTAILAMNHMFYFPDVPDNIHFTKSTETHTGRQILGWLRKDSTTADFDHDENTSENDLEYVHNWFPLHSFRRPQSMEVLTGLPGLLPPRRSQPLPFRSGSDYMSLVRPRSRYPSCMTLPAPPPPVPPHRKFQRSITRKPGYWASMAEQSSG